MQCLGDTSVNSIGFPTTIGCPQSTWSICCGGLFIGAVSKLICRKVVSISLWYLAPPENISLFNYTESPKIDMQTAKAKMQVENQREFCHPGSQLHRTITTIPDPWFQYIWIYLLTIKNISQESNLKSTFENIQKTFKLCPFSLWDFLHKIAS